jgi:hypothetical protein
VILMMTELKAATQPRAAIVGTGGEAKIVMTGPSAKGPGF